MKYLGGKQRLGKYISIVLHNLWNKYNNNYKFKGYLEPFCGSLGVFKHMTDLNSNHIIANDYHEDLISLWNAVKYNKFTYPKSISESQYNKAKLYKSPSAYKAFVGFGMSFGGRYFGAYSQKYLGNKKEDFCKEMTNSLKKIGKVIQFKNVKPALFLLSDIFLGIAITHIPDIGDLLSGVSPGTTDPLTCPITADLFGLSKFGAAAPTI